MWLCLGQECEGAERTRQRVQEERLFPGHFPILRVSYVILSVLSAFEFLEILLI